VVRREFGSAIEEARFVLEEDTALVARELADEDVLRR
jgi:hypothetical protein